MIRGYCTSCYYWFFNSPAGKWTLAAIGVAFLSIYGAGMIRFHGRYDAQYAVLATQVCDKGSWKIERSLLPPSSVLSGSFEGHKFKYAIYPDLFATKSHLYLECPTQLKVKMTALRHWGEDDTEGRLRWVAKVPGFAAFMATPGRIWSRNIDTRPLGFGGAPGLDLLVRNYGKVDAATLKKSIQFLVALNSNQELSASLLPAYPKQLQY